MVSRKPVALAPETARRGGRGGPPVVLLPGMMLDHRLYARQVAVLARTSVVITADITRSATIAAIADDVLKDAPPRFALVGLSMGGIVALEIWRRARERVTHLALLDTTPYADSHERRALRLEQIAAVETGQLREVLVDSLKPRYLARKNRGNRRLLRAILEMALANGPEVFRRQSLALRDRVDSVATLSTIDCPSLVLCGREDELCSVDFHATMAAAMPGADLLVLAGCGHLSAMEEPAAVTGALRRLLRRAS